MAEPELTFFFKGARERIHKLMEIGAPELYV
jgi:hypothetical protein